MAGPGLRSSASSSTASSTGNNKENKQHNPKASLRSSIQARIRHTIDYAQMPPVYKIPLWELNCGFGIVKYKHAQAVALKDAVRHQRKTQQADVTVVFAIRQAG